MTTSEMFDELGAAIEDAAAKEKVYLEAEKSLGFARDAYRGATNKVEELRAKVNDLIGGMFSSRVRQS
jgi:hypothetical protein